MTLEPIKLIDRSDKRTADLVVHTDRTIQEVMESARSLYPKWFKGDWSLSFKNPATGTHQPVNPELELSHYLAQDTDVFYWNATAPKASTGARNRGSNRGREQRATRAGRKKHQKGTSSAVVARPSSLLDRALAFLIDTFVIAILTYFFAGVLRGRGLAIIVPFAYYAFMESSDHQASLGKMLVGLRVMNLKGERIDLKQASIRSIVKVVTLPFSMLVYLVPFFTRYRQSVHDLAAGTMIVDNQAHYAKKV